VPAECTVCDAAASVSDACPHCGAACCPDHRGPPAHDCPGTDAGATGDWRLDLDGAESVPAGTEDSVPAGTENSVPADPHASAPPEANGETPGGEGSLSALFRPGIGLALLTLAVVAAALGAVAYAGPLDGGLDPGDVETQVLERTNEERRAAGVGTTTVDGDLAAVARAHSRDMRDRGFVDHTNPDGETPEDRVRAAGLDCRPGENIYQAPRGSLADAERALADHVVREWLDSPGHRETLLRERYTRQGVGGAVGEEAVYVTQVLC
jgi:uncharacterized protein YkwD